MTKKENQEFIDGVFKPLFFVAFTMCVFVVVVDYSFQLIDAIEIMCQ